MPQALRQPCRVPASLQPPGSPCCKGCSARDGRMSLHISWQTARAHSGPGAAGGGRNGPGAQLTVGLAQASPLPPRPVRSLQLVTVMGLLPPRAEGDGVGGWGHLAVPSSSSLCSAPSGHGLGHGTPNPHSSSAGGEAPLCAASRCPTRKGRGAAPGRGSSPSSPSPPFLGGDRAPRPVGSRA